MTSRTHIPAGIMAGVSLAYITKAPIETATSFITISAISSLIPDIDKVNSKIGHAFLPISLVNQLIFGHRSIFHSPFLYGMLGILGIMFAPSHIMLIYAALLGVLTHLLLDLITPMGIPILYPLSKKTYSLGKIKTGGIMEKCLRIVGVLVFLYYFGSIFVNEIYKAFPINFSNLLSLM